MRVVLFTLPRACSLLQLSWWNWSGFMLELLLLPLTVIAKANGGLLPTHQAPVGGDVCPLRVCSEAEDRRRRTATLSVLAVPLAGLLWCALSVVERRTHRRAVQRVG